MGGVWDVSMSLQSFDLSACGETGIKIVSDYGQESYSVLAVLSSSEGFHWIRIYMDQSVKRIGWCLGVTLSMKIQ